MSEKISLDSSDIISIVSLDIYEKKKSPVKKNENKKDANI